MDPGPPVSDDLSRRGRGPSQPLPEPDPDASDRVIVLRPRTLGPYGRPEPVVMPPLEAFADPQYEPPSGMVAVVEASGVWEQDDTEGGRVQSGRTLLRNNISVGSGTALSRMTGLLRTLVLLWVLNKSLNDTYSLANNTPNIIYELILGGVLTATLVPLFTDAIERKDDDATSAVVTFTVIALGAITAVGFLLTPLLIRLYSINTPENVDPATFRSVGTILAFFFVPQIFFYGLMALGSALLNARHRFFAAAWAPVLNNVIVIGVLLLVPVLFGSQPDLTKASSTTTACCCGSVWARRWASRSWRSRWFPRCAGLACGSGSCSRRAHPYVRRAIALSVWTFGYVIANQIAGIVISILAKPGSGGVTELPGGVPVLPAAARLAGRLDHDDVRARAGTGGRDRRHAPLQRAPPAGSPPHRPAHHPGRRSGC